MPSMPMPFLPRAASALTLSLLAALAGCGGSEVVTRSPASTGQPIASPSSGSSPYATGQSVQVEWRGTWYAATILAFESNGLVRIHYDGWSAEWDEPVDPSRIRAGGDLTQGSEGELRVPQFAERDGVSQDNAGTIEDPGGWTPPPDTELPVGLPVHVEWRGSWYRAEIVSAPTYGETCRVHYVNWDAEWDEDVSRTRVRVDGTR